MKRKVSSKALHSVRGFVMVLPHVRNVYPVEKSDGGLWQWGLKFSDGLFETSITAKTKTQADNERDLFVAALAAYWNADLLEPNVSG